MSLSHLPPTTESVVHVLNDPLFRKGSAEHTEDPGGPVYRQIDRAVRRNAPIEIVLPSFAGRPHNPAAHRRVGPDLGELYALQRLKNIADAVKSFYEPGVIFTLILDGRAYRPFYGYSDDEAMPYRANLERQITALGAHGQLRLVDMHDIMAARSSELESIDELVRHEVRLAWESGAVAERDALVRALRQGTETTAISAAVIELYKSGAHEHIDLRRFFGEAETAMQERAEHTAFEYAVLMTKLRELNVIAEAFEGAVRGTVHPKPGQYSPRLSDPRTTISPWHGVAIEQPDGSIVTRYEAVVYQDFEDFTAVFVDGDEAPFYYKRRR
ncbi:L-tyrosine/L-tryptophan isonitrile synthase family protein [Leifsonia sp. LS1]|uniref:L-tyrosine/L-tryptophan isonitrile synthase family protein n=1 Tax=Leifsonia sp. LS1 TaxID=2828483 RepID=UPI001CFD436E|nr:L-tyrosine/L-tryptophan isonitrile synthase family protein [Leifsonia sp. LS1]